MIEFIKIFVVGVCTIITLWLISLRLKKLIPDFLAEIFGIQTTAVIFSLIFTVSTFAALNTQGKTYLIVPLLIMLFIMGLLRDKNHITPKTNAFETKFTQILSIFIIFFFIQILKLTNFNDFGLRSLHDDFAFYAGVSDFLVKYGKETIILDPNTIYSWQPYHYFEMHLTALLSNLTNITSLKILFLVVYPVLYVVAIIAVREFLFKFGLKNVSLFLFLLAYVSNTLWGNTLNKLFDVSIFPNTACLGKDGTKLAIYPVLIIVLLNYIIELRRNPVISWQNICNGLFLGVVVFLYPTSIPIILFLILFFYGYFQLGKIYWKLIGLLVLIMLGLILYFSESCEQLIFITHPIQHLIACLPIFVILFFISIKLKLNIIKELIQKENLLLMLVGSFIFLIILRFLGILKLYLHPDSAQIYGNFFDEIVLLLILLFSLIILEKDFKFKVLLGMFMVLGIVINQSDEFTRHPMKNKALSFEIKIPHNKLLVWNRDTADFNMNTANWFIYFSIPYSNTRWNNSDYFPLLINLPQTSQITKISQRYMYEDVVKKASNYDNDYFNRSNSINIAELVNSNIR